jgi:hypothetical protein
MQLSSGNASDFTRHFSIFYMYLYVMSSSKTIVKKSSRRRGSVSLTKVRQAVASVFAQNGAGHNTRLSAKVYRPRTSSQPARIARAH